VKEKDANAIEADIVTKENALGHVMHRIRRRWPKVRILVRGGSQLLRPGSARFAASPALRLHPRPADQCEARCHRCALARAVREPSRGWSVQEVRRMHQLTNKSRTWSREEKVIARVEATEIGSDARFVVTNLTERAKVV
jgi:hypothetical protein